MVKHQSTGHFRLGCVTDVSDNGLSFNKLTWQVFAKGTRMYKALKLLLTALLLNTAFFANYAIASECYEPSPNLENLGDKYYDFDNIKTFSDEEKDKLTSFFNQLTGKWKGKSVLIDCFGPDNAAEKKYRNASIKTDHQRNANGGLTINVNQKMIEDSVNLSESVTLLEPSNTFEFEFISDNHLTFSEKFRRSNFAKKINTNVATSNTQTIINKIKSNITNVVSTSKPKTKEAQKTQTRLIEIIYDIKLDNGTLTLLRSYYTNGVFTGEEAWSMQAN